MAIFLEPLDLRTIFVNTFAGDPLVFLFLAMVSIFGLMAYFRVPEGASVVILLIFFVFVGYYINAIFYIIAIVFAMVYTVFQIMKAMGAIQ